MSANEFHVGQKVVCVNNSHSPRGVRWAADVPKIDAIYTVADFGNSTIDGIPALLLVEIKNSPNRNFMYAAFRFRPLEEKPDTIEWARQICRDVGARTKSYALRARSPA